MLLDDALLLTQREGVDFQSLTSTPTPEEWFLLSRVKGALTVGQLCSASGLGREKTLAMLDRLVEIGLVNVSGEGAPKAVQTPMPEEPAVVTPTPTPTPTPSPTLKPPDPVQTGGFRRIDTSNHGPAILEGLELSRYDYEDNPRTDSIVVEADDDDDLFEVGSVAHLSNINGPRTKPSSSFRGSTGVFAASPTGTTQPPAEPKGEVYGGAASDQEMDEIFNSPKPAAVPTANSSSTRPVADPLAAERLTAASTRPVPRDDAPKVDLFGDEPIALGSSTKSSTTLDFSKFPAAFNAFEPDPSLLSLSVEIDDVQKREILYVHAHLDHLSFYDLFALDADAQRKQIRQAYFKWSKRFHPDLFYRKETGPYGEMAESVFKWITKAHDTLAHKAKRAEYDMQLNAILTHHASSDSLDQVSVADEHKRSLAFDLVLKRGQQAEASGDLLGAVEHYKKAIAIRPDPATLLKCANLLLRANTKLDEAVLFARGVLRERGEDTEALVALGSALERKGDLEMALDAFERALNTSDDGSIVVHVERLRSALEN